MNGHFVAKSKQRHEYKCCITLYGFVIVGVLGGCIQIHSNELHVSSDFM